MKNYYERRIKILQNTGSEDAAAVAAAVARIGAQPLELWWRYILWAQKQGTPKFVEDLCKRCAECLNENPALMKDVDVEADERFAKIWLKIANTSTDDPTAIFKHMYRSKIAARSSLFYTNWATHSNQTDNNKDFAVKILKSGLKKKAEPRQTLLDLLGKLAPAEAAKAAAETDVAETDAAPSTVASQNPSSPKESLQQKQQQPPPPPTLFVPPAAAAPPPPTATNPNSVAKYRKSEVYPHGDVDVAPNGYEQSFEEIRFARWRRERERHSAAHSARVAELEARLREAEARAEMERKRAEAERNERELLATKCETYEANLAELEKAMTNHVEELVKSHEEDVAGKDVEIHRFVCVCLGGGGRERGRRACRERLLSLSFCKILLPCPFVG